MFRHLIKLSKFAFSHVVKPKKPFFEKYNKSARLLFSLPIIGFNTVHCEKSAFNFNFDPQTLEHEYLIKQACTVNINAASQLLTVSIIAVQDVSQRIRDAISNEISLIKQAVEWGENVTPDEHYEALIGIRGTLMDLRHNLQVLIGYLEYAERLATLSAEISYLSGNVGASDIICERIDQVGRAYRAEIEQNEELHRESLALQQIAIESSKIRDILELEDTNVNKEHDA